MKEETSILEKVPFSFSLEILKQTDQAGEFHIVGYAATTDFDLQGDVITEDALKNSQLDLLKNSTVLLNHDVTRPIGKVTKAEFDTHGLLIDVLISQTEPDIIQKIKEGVLNKFSIRGQVLERDKVYMPEYDRVVNVIKRMALVEVSLVSVPANPEAKAIGWYVSKALEVADGQSQGGNAMSEETVIEEIPEVTPQKEEQPPAEKEVPAKIEEEKKPDPVEKATDKPEDAPPPAASDKKSEAAEPPEVEKKKQAPAAPMSQLDPVWFLLDKLIAMGGPAGAVAQQIKAMLKQLVGDTSYPYPSSYPAPKGVTKEELNRMVSDEVKKQMEIVLKSVPTMRKGLVPASNSEKEDVKKQFESLPPEKKLKVALALQQG